MFRRYMAIKTWVSLLTGLLAWGWLLFLGIDAPLLWGLLTFLLNYVPNVGSVLAAIPPVLLVAVERRIFGHLDGARLPVNQRGGRLRHRAVVDGPGAGPVDPGRVRVADLLGLGAGPGGPAAVGPADDGGEDRAGE